MRLLRRTEGKAVARELSPSRLALRRLRRNPAAVAAIGLFGAVAGVCLAAPLVAAHVASTGPNDEHITETIRVGRRVTDVVSLSGIPIGPTWRSHFFLGADPNGRDILVRVLYGGRTSLEIGFAAAAVTLTIAVTVGVLSGYYRGWLDAIVSRVLDVMWAYPVILLAIALGTILAVNGISIGPLTLKAGSVLVPILIIGLVQVPYVARPIRAQVLSLREREFIHAARVLNIGSARVMARDILPNLTGELAVFAPLMIANSILLEAGLSFLGVGVQPPNPSWGNMIGEGVALISRAPHEVLAPGVLLVCAVLGLNGIAEALRQAFDTRLVATEGR